MIMEELDSAQQVEAVVAVYLIQQNHRLQLQHHRHTVQQDLVLMREGREDVKTHNLHFHLTVYELDIQYDC